VSTEALAQAFATTRGVLAGVEPEQLGDPTPCASWDVRALINHIIGGSQWFAASTNAGKSVVGPDIDHTEGDVLANYDAGIAAAVDAFSRPGALEKTIELPFGTFPGAAFLGLATTDTLTHGWDLAKATGQSTDIAPELAEHLLAQAKASIPDAFRGPDGVAPFGPAIEVDETAPAADRLAAFLGRKV
jgi:uncharacterized protein (TIGR03086 family)